MLQHKIGLDSQQAAKVIDVLDSEQFIQLVNEAIPIQDAIDLADFLVEVTKQFSKFALGANTVGGPTEIAAITKHEGFKWIKRKHYYSPQLNWESNYDQGTR